MDEDIIVGSKSKNKEMSCTPVSQTASCIEPSATTERKQPIAPEANCKS